MRRHVRWVWLSLVLAGCVVETETVHAPPPPTAAKPVPHIPPGHMPPPGLCRVWIPGRPPGQQPAPGPCDRLERQVPPNGYLLRG